MKEIKLSGNNRLPKYWVVKVPDSETEKELFKDTVYKYIQEILGANWSIKTPSTFNYWGHDGSEGKAGTDCFRRIEDFENNPTLLTLQEFINCFDEESEVSSLDELPAEFIIKCNSTEETNEAANHYKRGDYKWSFWPYVAVYNEDPFRKYMLFKAPNDPGNVYKTSHLPIVEFSFWKDHITPKTTESYKLPKNWKLHVTNLEDIREYLINKYGEVASWFSATSPNSFWLYSKNHNFAKPKYASIMDLEEVPEITLEQFNKYVMNKTEVKVTEIAESDFKVPSNWFMRGSSEFHDWLIETNRYKDSNVNGGFPDVTYWNPTSNFTNWKCSMADGACPTSTEITFQQFINYIYNKKPMNKQEFTVGGSTVLKEAFAKEVGVELFTNDSASQFAYLTPTHPEQKLQGCMLDTEPHFNLPEDWDEAVEYAKEYFFAKPTTKVLYFGELECTITEGDDFATTKYGNITKSEIETALKPFETELRICGYRMEIADVDSIRLKFGCQSGTIAEAYQLLEAFNN